MPGFAPMLAMQRAPRQPWGPSCNARVGERPRHFSPLSSASRLGSSSRPRVPVSSMNQGMLFQFCFELEGAECFSNAVNMGREGSCAELRRRDAVSGRDPPLVQAWRTLVSIPFALSSQTVIFLGHGKPDGKGRCLPVPAADLSRRPFIARRSPQDGCATPPPTETRARLPHEPQPC